MKLFKLFIIFICISCSNNINHKDKRTVFRYNESQGINSLDPAFANNERHTRMASQLYNRLFEIDDSLRLIPSLAKRYEISKDGRKYKFFLRDDVFFHDNKVFPSGTGRKLTASDVAYSLGRLTDPDVASPGSWILADINKYIDNKGFEVLNDSVLIINLLSPFSAFPELLSTPYTSIVPHEAVEYYGHDFRNHPVGTGPFMFKVWKEGEKLVLVKNPRYFEKDSTGKRLPYLDAISVTFIKDKQSEFLEFMKGNLDFLSGVQTVYKDELITRNGRLNPKYEDRFQMIKSPFLNTEYLGFMLDTTKIKTNPLIIKNIRTAINFSFDRVKMLKYLRNNTGIPALWGIIPKGMPGYTEQLDGYSYNPDKAMHLLAECGFPNGKGLPEIILHTTSDYLDLCEFIQHDLQKAGIRLKIEVSVGATFRQMVTNSRIAFFRGSWIADYPDAENYLALFYSHNFSPNGPNNTHFKNVLYDKYFKQAATCQNQEDRIDLYRKMNEIIVRESPVVPLYYDEALRFCPVSLKGFSGNPLNILKLKYVYKTNNAGIDQDQQ